MKCYIVKKQIRDWEFQRDIIIPPMYIDENKAKKHLKKTESDYKLRNRCLNCLYDNMYFDNEIEDYKSDINNTIHKAIGQGKPCIGYNVENEDTGMIQCMNYREPDDHADCTTFVLESYEIE